MAKRGGLRHDIARRRLGLGEVLRISGRIFAEHFWAIAAVGFAAYLPIELLMVQIAPSDPSAVRFELQAVQGIFNLLIGTLAMLFVIRLTANAIDGESTSVRDVWNAASRRYFSAVATTIAASFVFFGLLILLVVPGLAGLVYMTFALQVVALRAETGFHALKQSKRVVEGSFWRVAGYAFVLLVFSEASPFVDQLAPSPWMGAALGAAVGVLGLYLDVLGTVLYLNLERTRFGEEA